MLRYLFFFLLLSSATLFAQEDPQAIIDQGIELHDAGQYKEAIELYEKAVALGDDTFRAYYEMGYSYYALKDYDKALEYCDRVIKGGKKYTKECYILKGNTLDDMGKSDKAIKVYEKGLKEFPDEYLLYFNVALSHFRLSQSDEAEAAFIRALEINPNHASSHFYLAKLSDTNGKRVPAILSLYYFLMLEPQGKRAEEAFPMLQDLLTKGTSKSGENEITISLDPNAMGGEFSTIEMLLSLNAASSLTTENKDKPAEGLFVENTTTLFAVLGESSSGKKGFWWDFYAKFYSDLKEAGHAEAFCYYIASSFYKGAGTWMDENPDKFQAFADWVNE
jgi:tetratricopeptide (TPR) repeat protein